MGKLEVDRFLDMTFKWDVKRIMSLSTFALNEIKNAINYNILHNFLAL